jgi:uncharacterized protein
MLPSDSFIIKSAIVTLPGIGNSNKTHWQTHWELGHPDMQRFAPASWDKPDLTDWIESLDRAVRACATPPLLVAHSLACLLVAHWHLTSSNPIAGAFLVAVPDPLSSVFPVGAAEFADAPEIHFSFPTLIIASSNDRYGALDYVRGRASHWGAGMVDWPRSGISTAPAA